MSSSAKFLLLACLYFSQGLPYGFFTVALPTMMRREGASLPEVGLTALLALPWMLKFSWAPLIDRYGIDAWGRKRGWILILQAAGVLLFFGLGLASRSGGYAYLVYGFFLANLVSATQDIACDGLAVGLLTPKERGVGNGLQVAGYRLGMVFGGGLILMIIGMLGWHGAFFLMGTTLALASIPLLYYREEAAPPRERQPVYWRMLWSLVRRPGFPMWLLIMGFYKFGDAMTSQMLGPFFVDMNLTDGQIGLLKGTVGFVSGLLGAIGGGFLVTYLGRFRAILYLGIIQAFAVLGYWLFAKGLISGDNALALVVAAEHFTGGLATAALFTAMMDVCRPECAATDYTAQASIVVMATGVAKALSGFTAQYLGFGGNFMLSFVLCLIGALWFGFAYRSGSEKDGVFQPQP